MGRRLERAEIRPEPWQLGVMCRQRLRGKDCMDFQRKAPLGQGKSARSERKKKKRAQQELQAQLGQLHQAKKRKLQQAGVATGKSTGFAQAISGKSRVNEDEGSTRQENLLWEASERAQRFERVFRVLNAMEASLGSMGSGFAQNPRLGYLGSDPTLLGSCMIASVAIQIPLLSMKPEFRTLCQQLKLQAQVFPCQEFGVQPGVWEVQNSIRLGSSEVEQVNAVIEACCALLDLEARLERGHADDLTQTMNLLGVPQGAGPGTGPGAMWQATFMAAGSVVIET
eukprot:s2415_g12.t1